MRQKRLQTFLATAPVLTLLLICIVVGEAVTRTSLTEITNWYDDRIPNLMERYDTPGAAVGLIRDGEPVWSEGYGYIDREQSARVDTDTYFRAESMTKSLTAWAVMILVEQDRLDLDDPVEKYLTRWEFPETEFDTRGVTIRRLLSHTAGIFSGIFSTLDCDKWFPPVEQVLIDIDDGVESWFVAEPGERFVYSNPGYIILELVIEEVTGQSYREFVRDHLLTPLGMHSSGFTPVEYIVENRVTGYLYTGETVSLDPEPVNAHGGLYTTVDEMALFISAGLPGTSGNTDILSQESLEILYTPVEKTEGFYTLATDSMALGHFTERLDQDVTVISHGGQGSGWLAFYHMIPETGDGLLIFTNSEQSWRLLGHLITDWSDWIGVQTPGIGIAFSQFAAFLWLLTALVFTAGSAGLGYLIRGLWIGHREFDTKISVARLSGAMKLSAAVVMFVLAWWISGYYMIAGMFPVISRCLTAVLSICAAVFLLYLIFPRISKKNM